LSPDFSLVYWWFVPLCDTSEPASHLALLYCGCNGICCPCVSTFGGNLGLFV